MNDTFEGHYALTNYDEQVPFTSFLPGIAGLQGIPIWAYYVNRGQGICSFGIQDKAHAIMEFQPAVRAYEDTEINGFRTFLRLGDRCVEPFAHENSAFQKNLVVSENLFAVEAVSESLGVTVEITYFVLPNETVGGLVRRVRIRNSGETTYALEGLDGMPRLIPYGILNDEHMVLSNLLRSYVTVHFEDENVPFFTLRSSTEDSDVINQIDGGIFVTASVDGQAAPVLYDRWNVFGEWSTLRTPSRFYAAGLAETLAKDQIIENKFPCAFIPFSADFTPGKEIVLEEIYGYAKDPAIPISPTTAYLDAKQAEAEGITDDFLAEVTTHSAYPLYDAYIRQSYLDNLLRGGYPVERKIGGEDYHLYVYSRKHGDPERDYNFFVTAAEPWSQGNGNFRDVCQNRRNDVFFHPEAGLQNLHMFMNLIQADGYNPLEIRGVTLRLKEGAAEGFGRWLEKQEEAVVTAVSALEKEAYSPGRLFGIEGMREEEALLAMLEPVQVAAFKEGYWVDHWVYLLDLVQGARAVFPDRFADLLFTEDSLTFYQSAYQVKPRKERYVLVDGVPLQQDSVRRDKEFYQRYGETGRILTDSNGEEVQISLYGKLFLLASLKFATRDSLGAGIEMEASKPGWNDAMNGVPAQFGSSIPETLELKRLLLFLESVEGEGEIRFPVEFVRFLNSLRELVAAEADESVSLFDAWSKRSDLREDYRAAIAGDLVGDYAELSLADCQKLCRDYVTLVDRGLARARELSEGFLPTYLVFSPSSYEENGDNIVVTGFEPRALPRFLEAPAKELKVLPTDEAVDLYEKVETSPLFDEAIGMYKTSESLEEETVEIGRIRTFTAGWLERESIFTHMHYKFLLGLLYAGAYEEFFEEIERGLLPFYQSSNYGRSPIEHCSFIASSVNPDPSLPGRGFISRLSGATAEALSMWVKMMVGEKWFSSDGELRFTFAPILPGSFFDEQGELSFTLLSHSTVTYLNPQKANTYPSESSVSVQSIEISDGLESEHIDGDTLPAHWAEKLRAGEKLQIRVALG